MNQMGSAIPVEERQVETAVESSAKKQISRIVTLKDEIKKKKIELEDGLKENERYENVVQAIKDYNKSKKTIKEDILKNNAELRALDQEVKDLTADKNELQLSLFDNLLTMNQQFGKKKIVDASGVEREITLEATVDL